MIGLLFNWRVWAAVVVAVFLAGTHWKAYKTGQKVVQAEWDAQVAEQQAQTIKRLEEAAKKTAELQTEKEKLRKAKNVEISRLNTDLADALERLRNRPERPREGDLPSDTGTGPAPSCTGAGLYRADAEFLSREAARAKRLQLDLAECQAAYGRAREALK